MNFNLSDFQSSNSSNTSVSTRLNLSSLVLTGQLTSVGISNSVNNIISSSDINLTGTAKLTMQTGARAGSVLTSDLTGNSSWQPPTSTFTSALTSTGLKSSQNIVLSGTAKLKYPTGTSGQILQSDSTGLLSLVNMPTSTISFIQGVLTTGLTYTTVANSANVNIGTITIPTTGTYLISYRLGINAPTAITFTGQQIFQITGVSGSSSSVIMPTLVSTVNVDFHFPQFTFIASNLPAGTYTFNSQARLSASTTINGTTSGASSLWALKLA